MKYILIVVAGLLVGVCIGFRMQPQSVCGAVSTTTGKCLDGQYQFGTVCKTKPVVPCDGKYFSKEEN